MQSIGNVVFKIFDSDPASANSRTRCVQSQGRDQSNRRVHENKNAIPSMPRDVASTLAHKTGGWVSSLNLGNIKPVFLIPTLMNQFSPILGLDTTEATWSPSTAVEKIMTIVNCSAEDASEILKIAMESAEDGDSYTPIQILGIAVLAGIGGVLIGGALAYKGIPAIRERLCSGNADHSPDETRCSDESKTTLTEECSALPKKGLVPEGTVRSRIRTFEQ